MRRAIALLALLAPTPACDEDLDYQGPDLCPGDMDPAVCFEAVLACNAYETAHDECHYRYSFPADQMESTTSAFNRCMFYMAKNPDYLPWTWCWSLETTCDERMAAIETGTENEPTCGHLRPKGPT